MSTQSGPGRGRADRGLDSVLGERRQIARFLLDRAGAARGLRLLERTVNGQPGLIAQLDGVTVTVFAFEVADDQIKHIWAIRNPDKLRPWTTG
jgi:hypothetical protein